MGISDIRDLGIVAVAGGVLYLAYSLMTQGSKEDQETANTYMVDNEITVVMDRTAMGDQRVMIVNGYNETKTVDVHGNAYAQTGRGDAWLLKDLKYNIPAKGHKKIIWDWKSCVPCYEDYYDVYYKIWCNGEFQNDGDIVSAFYNHWAWGCGHKPNEQECYHAQGGGEGDPGQEDDSVPIEIPIYTGEPLFSVQPLEVVWEFQQQNHRLVGDTILTQFSVANNTGDTIRDVGGQIIMRKSDDPSVMYSCGYSPGGIGGTFTLLPNENQTTDVYPLVSASRLTNLKADQIPLGDYDLYVQLSGRREGETLKYQYDNEFVGIIRIVP